MNNGWYGVDDIIAEHYDVPGSDVRSVLESNASKVFDLSNARCGKISAIKEFRRATGFGLKDSKDAVEAIMTMALNNDAMRDNMHKTITALEANNERLQDEVTKLRAIVDMLIEVADIDMLKELFRRQVGI